MTADAFFRLAPPSSKALNTSIVQAMDAHETAAADNKALLLAHNLIFSI
jgi:hypothetical protein